MDRLKEKIKNKTSNEILLELFKNRFQEESLANISVTTLRKRLKKALEDKTFIPVSLKNTKVSSNNTTDLESDTVSQKDQNICNKNEKLDRVLSKQFEKSLSLKQNQVVQKIDDKILIDQDRNEINKIIYSTQLTEFFKTISTGRIENISINDFVNRFNLRECNVNVDGFSLINCVKQFLGTYYEQNIEFEDIRIGFKNLNKAMIEKILQVEFSNYINSIDSFFDNGSEDNNLYRLIHLIPHVFKINLYVLESINDNYLKIDFYGHDSNSRYIILKLNDIEESLNIQENNKYSFFVPIQNENNSANIANSQNDKPKNIKNSNSDSKSNKSRRKKRPLTYQGNVKRKKKYGAKSNNTVSITSEPLNNITYQQVLDDDTLNIPGTYTNQNQIENQTLFETNRPESYLIAYVNRDEEMGTIIVHSVGLFGGENKELMCEHCSALFYIDEVINSGQFTLCCMEGKISLPYPPEYPPELKILIYPDPSNRIQVKNSQEFLQNVRPINGVLAFAAVSARIDTSIRQNWNYVYKIHGNIYRSIAPVLQDEDQHFNMQGGQYYILDTDLAQQMRVSNKPNLNPKLNIKKKNNFYSYLFFFV